MIKKITLSLITSTALVLFLGCSKDVEEYNKPAIYWYTQMIDSISRYDLDKADDYYTSLQGEHIGSPLLPEATMIMALAHLHNKEYILSEYFFDEYIKRYATYEEKEFSEFMKIKAKYMALPNVRRDQFLLYETLEDCEKFKQMYPNSKYFYFVDTMATNLFVAKAFFNKSIAGLYRRIDKPLSAKYYENKDNLQWIKSDEIKPPYVPWYREWFEGDGEGSWYGFLLPDIPSVVSRNSVHDDNQTKIKEK